MRQLVGTTGSSWDELLELIKSTWKLPYRKTTDSTDRIYVGTKIVADFGAVGAPALVAVGDLPAYRNAHEKLRAVLAGAGDEVAFLVLGPRFLAERRRAGLL